MDQRTEQRVRDWESRSFGGGYAALQDLADAGFSGAVVTRGDTWLFMLNGRGIGVFQGSVDHFGDDQGTVYEAPDPSLPLLFTMLEHGGEQRAKYYTNDTAISEAHGTLSDAQFTGYIELSENVLSGDYYVVYYGGRSMSCAFVGSSERLVTGDEAFQQADDEVGIYEVRTVEIDVVEIPDPEPADGGAAAGVTDDGADHRSDGPAATERTQETSDATDEDGHRDDPRGESARQGRRQPDEREGDRQSPGGPDPDPDHQQGRTDGRPGEADARRPRDGDPDPRQPQEQEAGGRQQRDDSADARQPRDGEAASRQPGDQADRRVGDEPRPQDDPQQPGDRQPRTHEDRSDTRQSGAAQSGDGNRSRRGGADDGQRPAGADRSPDPSRGRHRSDRDEEDRPGADDRRDEAGRSGADDRRGGDPTSRQPRDADQPGATEPDRRGGASTPDRDQRGQAGDDPRDRTGDDREAAPRRAGDADAGPEPERDAGAGPAADRPREEAPARDGAGTAADDRPDEGATRPREQDRDPAPTSDRAGRTARDEGTGARSGTDHLGGTRTGGTAGYEPEPLPAEAFDETRPVPSLDPDLTSPEEAVATGSEADGAGDDEPRSESRTGADAPDEPATGTAADQDPLAGDAPGESADEPPTTEATGARRSPEAATGGAVRSSDASRDPGGEAVDAAVGEEAGELRSELADRERRIEDLEAKLADLRVQRDGLREDRDQLREEVERLEAEIADLEEEVETLRGRLNEGTEGRRRLSEEEALEGTNLFVRYDSKSGGTLEAAHAGDVDAEEVDGNLRLEHHTQFEADNVAVDGQPFEEYLPGSIYYRYVEWVVRTLLYEIRETGNVKHLKELYDALPRIDRAELLGSVGVEYVEDGETYREQRQFDVVLRDRMGDPLLVADINDSRAPASQAMMESVVENASEVKDSNESLASAMLVTASFFEPGALETADEAAGGGGGLMGGSSKASYVKLSRKQGYHLLLVETRDSEFHVNVPEL